MSIAIRSSKEIERLRAAGKVVGNVLQQLEKAAVPGVTTIELARISDEIIAAAGAVPLFKGVKHPAGKAPFPASICASINEELVHGIPGPRALKNGDIISIDCGVRLSGYCGDAAVTLMIGKVAPEVQRLVRVTQELLDIAVQEVRPDRLWSEVAGRMQRHAEQAGFGVVRDYVGHGIGRQMHEDPKLPNYVGRELLEHDIRLRKGMVLAVEPMVTMESYRVSVRDDAWTVVTVDGKPSAHWEHTMVVVEHGAEVLTLP